MPSFRLLVPALLALALVLGLPPAASAQSFSDTQRGDIETIVRNYLIAHPEVLEEAMNELSKRQAAAEAEKHEASVATNAETIFNSPRGVVLGNKDGDVTFVEFFDYNCGYCKRAMADMLDLMKADPKLKVVLKEFPVLSEGSVEAAKVAVAVRMQDPTGKKYLDFHQKLLGGRGPADKARAMAAAKDAGLDTARIEKDLASPEVRATIEENFKLAESMGMNGTPSYVIGKQVVVGAIGLDGLKEKIALARCGKATC
jgi:protein-disulfide isomerase